MIDVTSKAALDDLIATASSANKLVVLEVRREQPAKHNASTDMPAVRGASSSLRTVARRFRL